MLSGQSDRDAATRFCAQAQEVVGHGPEQVTIDDHEAYPRAIRETRGPTVVHRRSRDKNNVMEQDHCGIKGRCRSRRGVGSVSGTARFRAAYERPLAPPDHAARGVPLGCRAQFCTCMAALQALVLAA